MRTVSPLIDISGKRMLRIKNKRKEKKKMRRKSTKRNLKKKKRKKISFRER